MKARSLGVWIPAVRAGSGADVFALRLERGLRRAGHRPVLQWFDRRYELLPWRLRAVAPPAGIDIIQAGSWQGFAFKRAGLPLVVTEHQYISHPAFLPHRRRLQSIYHDVFVRRCVARSYEAADALVAVSGHVADAMQRDLGCAVEMIHNWVDAAQFVPAAGPAGETSSRPFRLLFVGNPSPWKGADVLPPLAAKLGSDFEITCLGGLRHSAVASRGCANLRAAPSVAPSAMPGLYRQHDAVLVPTRYEAFGYVALEAMACGLPVVGFASTGTAELAIHGKTALLAPMGDIDALAALVRRLASAPLLQATLGAAGRARVLEFFDEPLAVGKYVALYRRLIAAGGTDAEH